MQKSSIIDFRLGSKYDSCQYCQKSSYLKDISPVKTFCVFILTMHIFSQISAKLVTESNKRLNLWNLFFYWGTQFLITADWIIENDLCQILCLVLEFLSSGEGLGRFSRPNVLPKVSKVTDLSKTSKGQIRVNFDLLKVSKMTINFEQHKVSKIISLKISSHGEARNIKPHSKGSIGYSASGGSDVITS